jgi:hypothetical protein
MKDHIVYSEAFKLSVLRAFMTGNVFALRHSFTLHLLCIPCRVNVMFLLPFAPKYDKLSS